MKTRTSIYYYLHAPVLVNLSHRRALDHRTVNAAMSMVSRAGRSHGRVALAASVRVGTRFGREGDTYHGSVC